MSEEYSEGWVGEAAMATKWCSHAMVAGHMGAINRNRNGTPAPGTECITTRCAHWEVRRQIADRAPMGRCRRDSRDA